MEVVAKKHIYWKKNSFLTLFALGVFPSLGLPCLGGRGIQKNCWGGGREDLTEPHFKNKNTKNLKKKKQKERKKIKKMKVQGITLFPDLTCLWPIFYDYVHLIITK